jgi:multiple sugar transport system ATP-binding protein
MASITYEHVWKKFGEVVAVQDLDIVIDDKEFLVFVGPSGCGKSTSLRMLAGLEEISEGTIRIGDRVVNDVPPKDRNIAMVFQSYALYPHMNVRDNMAFGLKVRGVRKDEIDRLVTETAAMLEIEPLLPSFPRQLSGGQRQRVAMGRAIVRNPRVFLFDEPLSNLDAALRSQMRVELKRLHQKLASTVVYVTHDHVEAMTLADRIAVMQNGVLQQTGTPDEVFNAPRNRFVAGFIGSPPMNFFEGILSEAQPDRIEGERFIIRLEPGQAKTLDRWKGEKLEIGIRPQHLVLWTSNEAEPPETLGQFRGTLEVKETMGWETFLHVRLKSELAVAQVESSDALPLQPGGKVVLTAAAEHIHVFSTGGEALLDRGAPAGQGEHVPYE